MNSQQAQLQMLIAEIDALLNKASPRLPWVMAGEANQQRQVLERTRQCLQSLQTSLEAPSGWGPLSPESEGDKTSAPLDPQAIAEQPEASSRQVLQALLQEMQYLRNQTLQPLRAEVRALQQQRQQLQQEVKQLEQTRQQNRNGEDRPQLDAASVEAVVGQLRESLLKQLMPQLQALQAQALEVPQLNQSDTDAAAGAADLPKLESQQRLEQLQRVQAQMDYMLLQLDSNLRAVFESMEQSIQSYRDSLRQGLDTMHGLGQQGEVIFRAFVNHLAQQLNSEFDDAYFEASVLPSERAAWLLEAEDRRAAAKAPEKDTVPQDQANASDDDLGLDDLDLDVDIDDDEEVTLFQLDEEITQLQFDVPSGAAGEDEWDEAAAVADEAATVYQTEPMAWSEAIAQAQGRSAAESGDETASPTSPEPATGEDAADEDYADIDALYESLFGASSSPEAADSEAAATTSQAESFSTAADGEEASDLEADEADAIASFGDALTASLMETPATQASPEMGDAESDVDQSLDELGETLLPSPGMEGVEASLLETEASPTESTDHEAVAATASDTEDTLASFFGEEIAEEIRPDERSTAADDTIESLAELLPAVDNSPKSRSGPSLEEDLESGSDAFVPAPPEEDLLTADQNESQWAQALNLLPDSDIFEQLNADLSSLEGLSDEAIETPLALDLEETDEAPTASQDAEDADLAAEAPPAAADTDDSAAITLEDWGNEDNEAAAAATPDFPADDTPSPTAADLFSDVETAAPVDREDTAPESLTAEAMFEGAEADAGNEVAAWDDLFEEAAPETPPADTENPITSLEEASAVESLFAEDDTSETAAEPPASEEVAGTFADFLADEPSDSAPVTESSDEASASLTAEAFSLGEDVLAGDRTEEAAPQPEDAEAEATDEGFDDDWLSLSSALSEETSVPPESEAAEDEVSLADLGESLDVAEPGNMPGDEAPVTSDTTATPTAETAAESESSLSFDEVSLDWSGTAGSDAESAVADDSNAVASASDAESDSEAEWLADLNLALDGSDEEPPPSEPDTTWSDLAAGLEDETTADSEDAEPDADTGAIAEAFSLADLDLNLNLDLDAPEPESREAASEASEVDDADWSLFADEDSEGEATASETGQERLSLDDLSFDSEDADAIADREITEEKDWGLEEALSRASEAAADEDAADLAALESIDLFAEAPAASESPATDIQTDLTDTPESADASASPPPPSETETFKLEAAADDWGLSQLLESDEGQGRSPTSSSDPDQAATAAGESPETEAPDPAVDVFGTPANEAGAADSTLDRSDRQEDDTPPTAREATTFSDALSAPPERPTVAPDSQTTTPAAAILAEIPTAPTPTDQTAPQEEWFLGIDLGTTGLSAVLMNRLSGQAHPFYWIDAAQGSETVFRLPAIALLTSASFPQGWQLEAAGLAATQNGQGDQNGLRLNQMKPLLKTGIPHETADQWHPLVQWSDTQVVPLQQIMAGIQALLSSLRSPASGKVGAAGLEPRQLQQALDNLQGVILGHPASWSDTYRVNLREAVLATQLVRQPDQVFFLDEAIAAILSGLPEPTDEVPPRNGQSQTLYQCNWQGGTVVVNGGAAFTELGLVDLPRPLSALSREDFALRSIAYGGDALDLDIICQLLVPPERRQPRNAGRRAAAGGGWSWQATRPELENARWDSLELESLDLPRLAEPDLEARIRLRQRLESSLLGQSLLEAARHLKLILQNQAQCYLELGDQCWRILRRDLESRILVPYIQRINQHLNALLSQTGIASQGINQVICTGGNASFTTIARWLRQKFPNATIIQDTYPSQRPASCSRVAYGLVNLCRYPQVLDSARHQYSDYFLLQEILRTVPEQPLPLSGLLHVLQEAGVNTEVCQQRIVAILEGHLPPGLVPDVLGRSQLSEATLNTARYRGLTAAALFSRQSSQIYVPDEQQRQRLRQHLATLFSNKRQTLSEPLIAQLVMP